MGKAFLCLFLVFSFSVVAGGVPSLAAEEIFLDAIVASIDDRPITLNEVAKHLNPPRKLSLAEASSDAEFKRALDVVILTQLVDLEAQQRRIGVQEEEMAEYLAEIAKRNNMTQEQFVEALKREGRSEAEYREQVKNDILRSKLASSLSRGSTAVSDAEVDQAIKEKQGAPKKIGRTVTLRQILISSELHDSEESEKLIEEVKQKLADGEKFDDLARIYSESPEKDDGGSLGTLAESELTPEVQDAIQGLEVGDLSGIVDSEQGLHLFFLEDRTEADDDDDDSDDLPTVTDEEREQVRNALKQKKLESKMSEFFTTELYKLHSVDKKI